MHLPRYNFSPSNKEQNMATRTSRTGLKLATNSGPRMFTHHVVMNTTTPEPNIPYITQQIKHSNNGNQLHDNMDIKIIFLLVLTSRENIKNKIKFLTQNQT